MDPRLWDRLPPEIFAHQTHAARTPCAMWVLTELGMLGLSALAPVVTLAMPWLPVSVVNVSLILNVPHTWPVLTTSVRIHVLVLGLHVIIQRTAGYQAMLQYVPVLLDIREILSLGASLEEIEVEQTNNLK